MVGKNYASLTRPEMSSLSFLVNRANRDVKILEHFERHFGLCKSDKEEMYIYKYNVCDNCGINMNLDDQKYICPQCGLIMVLDGEGYAYDNNKSTCGMSMKTIDIDLGYGDYSIIQRKQIYQILRRRAKECDTYVPDFIIRATTKFYNDIQQITIDQFNLEGELCGKKKYLHRGNTLIRILAAVMYHMAQKCRMPLRPSEVSAFMRLPDDSISAGLVELIKLNVLGLIELPKICDIEHDYALRYLADLQIISFKGPAGNENLDYKLDHRAENYIDFIDKILARARKLHIGLGSVRNSRVIGVIWILIKCERFDISISRLEMVCSRVKKNTFGKFADKICQNINLFEDIFRAENIRFPPRPKKLKMVLPKEFAQ